MAIAAGSAGEAGGKCSVWWLIIGIFTLTLGEIYASPVGLSFVTKAAPPELISALMGVWFLALGMGGYLAGEVGALYGTMSKVSFFFLVMAIGGANGVLMCLLVPCINQTLDTKSDQVLAEVELAGFTEVALSPRFDSLPESEPRI